MTTRDMESAIIRQQREADALRVKHGPQSDVYRAAMASNPNQITVGKVTCISIENNNHCRNMTASSYRSFTFKIDGKRASRAKAELTLA